MLIFSRAIFGVVRWAARKGLRGEQGNVFESEGAQQEPEAGKLGARRTEVRGETHTYWYLRRHGYVFVARNYVRAEPKERLI